MVHNFWKPIRNSSRWMADNRNGIINIFQIIRSVAGVLQVQYLSPGMTVHMGQVIFSKKSSLSDLESILMSSSRANASITSTDALNFVVVVVSTSIIQSSSPSSSLTPFESVRILTISYARVVIFY